MNLFELFATITLDDNEYRQKIGESEKHTSAFAGKLKSGLATAGKAAAVGLAAVSAAAVAVGKSALESYADYEQLVGGVETLFKESSGQVMKYAENAYKTAGLSANEYMETVTSFSASLLQSLDGDTQKAAKYADMAVTDMSDNANKMGTSIEMIQNAYQGFAKQNFTMLDNLKLGYGGTKEEMQRLLEDAEKISGIEYDISSYADIVDAIHVVQEEMGIAGTTAKEASETISGSVASMKSAWENLVVGIADENANIDKLMDEFLQSVETVAKNVLPVVERVLSNIFKTLADNGPKMVRGAVDLFLKIAVGALEALPGIVASVPEIIDAIIDGFSDAWPEIYEIGKNIVKGVWEGMLSLASWAKDKVTGFFGGLVDGVKDKLDIHSPSRVFAEIGENMARGLEQGWDDQYDSVYSHVTGGLNFGEAKIGVGESVYGLTSAAMLNQMQSAGNVSGNTTINLVLPDGTQFARYYLPSFIEIANSNGTPIANPV